MRIIRSSIPATPRVLYESARLLVVSKPPGISHHNDVESGQITDLGLLNTLRGLQEANQGVVGARSVEANKHLRNLYAAGRLFGVHRLDRVTSGVVLLAKDEATAGEVSALFRR